MKNLSKINFALFTYFLLVSMFFSACIPSKDVMYSKSEINEKGVTANMLNIISNQIITFRTEKKYATSEELEIGKRQESGYKIEMTSDGKSFQIWATPTDYGKTGRLSYYADSNDGDIHGADHQGRKADSNDPIVQKILGESKEKLKNNREQN
jgi:hypothetical protein